MSKKSLAIRREGRELAVAANADLTDAVTAFGHYTDPAGASATSPAGLMKAFNVAVKREFGMRVEDMPDDMQLHVASLRLRVSRAIREGIAANLLRTDIKRAIREAVKASAAAYQMMTGGHYERH